MGQHFRESSWWKSLNQRLQNYLFFECRGECHNIFLTGDCVALFVFLGNCEFERKSLKICETVRNEEPTMRKTVKPCGTR